MLKKILLYLVVLAFSLPLLAKSQNTLVKRGKMGNFSPKLSTSWKAVNQRTIEMTLAPGVNASDVVITLQKWFKRSIVEKKGSKKILITTKYSLEQALNRLSIIAIKPQEKKNTQDFDDPLKMLMEPGSQKTTQVSLIQEKKIKSDGYFTGKVIKTQDSFPSIKMKIRVISASQKNSNVKAGDIINAEPYLKIANGNPDASDEDTSDNLGALFLQKNDRIDAIIKEKKGKRFELLKVQSK